MGRGCSHPQRCVGLQNTGLVLVPSCDSVTTGVKYTHAMCGEQEIEKRSHCKQVFWVDTAVMQVEIAKRVSEQLNTQMRHCILAVQFTPQTQHWLEQHGFDNNTYVNQF